MVQAPKLEVFSDDFGVKGDLFSYKHSVPDSQEMRKTFQCFESYKRDVSPESSKADYQKHLQQKQREKNTFDSNVSNYLSYQKKLI